MQNGSLACVKSPFLQGQLCELPKFGKSETWSQKKWRGLKSNFLTSYDESWNKRISMHFSRSKHQILEEKNEHLVIYFPDSDLSEGPHPFPFVFSSKPNGFFGRFLDPQNLHRNWGETKKKTFVNLRQFFVGYITGIFPWGFTVFFLKPLFLAELCLPPTYNYYLPVGAVLLGLPNCKYPWKPSSSKRASASGPRSHKRRGVPKWGERWLREQQRLWFKTARRLFQTNIYPEMRCKTTELDVYINVRLFMQIHCEQWDLPEIACWLLALMVDNYSGAVMIVYCNEKCLYN